MHASTTVKPPISDAMDFQTLVKEVGYIKARQMLKQLSTRTHQKSIQIADQNVIDSLRPQRLKSTIELSLTIGDPVIENDVDKMAEAAAAAKQGDTALSKEDKIAQDAELAVKRSRLNQELMLAQLQTDQLPAGLGDTISIMMCHVTRINCARNKLKSLLSYKTPQFSPYHIRNVETMTLSGNDLTSLCPDFGMMNKLYDIDLSDNNLSNLPPALSELQKLTKLNLSQNNLSILNDAFGDLKSLEELDVSLNQISQLPIVFTKLKNLKILYAQGNALQHMAMLPKLATPATMWHQTQCELTAKVIYVNVITKERLDHPSTYDYDGIYKLPALHDFVPSTSHWYKKRALWLSVCQTYEWEPILDEEHGALYYRNNVSGETLWTMPKDLDLIGNMPALEYIDVSDNQIKNIADSICDIETLNTLLANNNRLHELPENLGNLKNLKTLSVKSNELDGLPNSICFCESMQSINVYDNHIRRLPMDLGNCKNLEYLNVKGNILKVLAYSVGYCPLLKELNAHDNPLEDPPFEVVLKGLESLMWYLRQRFMIEARGMPTEMTYQSFGVGEEVIEIYPEFKERIVDAIARCKETSELNLQLLGIKHIPREIYKLTNLKEFRLDQNQNLVLKEFSSELKTLKLLSLRTCRIILLPTNISMLGKLETLDCQDNMMKMLPKQIVRLRKLKRLDLSKNKLYVLPNGFGAIEKLKVLDVDGNNLSEIPHDLGKNPSLRTLNLARNRILIFPFCMSGLTALVRLNVENNKLKRLPESIKDLNLRTLRCGYNILESLPNDMFEGNLGRSIRFLSCPENNLLEIPMSYRLVSPMGRLEAEYNPLISPPNKILCEGAGVLIAYFRIRYSRMEELRQKLTAEDFVINMDNVRPVATETLEDGTGFLTPHDLDEFDDAINEYVHGELYLCPASGTEIVKSIVDLRDYRETELYLQCLTAFYKSLEEAKLSEDYGRAVLKETRRPWGRNGELVNCYVISMHALLRDTPPNKYYQPEGRPAMIHAISKYMPKTSFPFSKELLKDSLRLYLSPYGQIADTENIEYLACDCIDDRRLKPLSHEPCEKPSVVLIKIIYTEEEAARRDEEEDMFSIKFDEIDSEVRLWLNTDEGYDLLNKQIKIRRKVIAEDLGIREEVYKNEMYKERMYEAAVSKIARRMIQFEENLAFDVHHISSAAEGKQMVKDADKKLARQKKRVIACAEALEKLEELSGMDRRGLKALISDELVRKYSVNYYNEAIKAERKKAIRENWRRPWDGEDGAFFEFMKNRIVLSAQEMAAEVGPDAKVDIMDALAKEEEDMKKLAELEKAQEDENKPEYDWEDTEDMSRYSCELYDRYVYEHRGIFGKMRSLF
mmetsp:Transcript_35485/g.66233  ORF Transcript_35485/g.66233 Transcript_35485/m.66233 type:complete len:1350 (-) Transcript_35485:239-4288(-)